jgi:hypothetical protein
MKKLILTISIITLSISAFSETYQIQISSNDKFRVSAPSQWTLKQTKYNENQDAEFSIRPKDKSFVLKMFFLKVNEKIDSKGKVKDRLIYDGKEFLSGSVQSEVEVKEMNLKNGFGFYATFTDKETIKKSNPKPTDYPHMTRGYIKLSDDTVLGFFMLTHRTDDKVFKGLAKYLTGYIK